MLRYVNSDKNDRVDAEALCDELSRLGMGFVAVKTIEQQDNQAAQRVREELVGQRTVKANQVHGLVGEYGIITPIGSTKLHLALPRWLEDAEAALTDDFRALLASSTEELRNLDRRIADLDDRIAHMVKTDPVASGTAQHSGKDVTLPREYQNPRMVDLSWVAVRSAI